MCVQSGWDVAFTSDGICLLEVNLSCNFFRGTFDKAVYFQFIHDYWTMLEAKEDAQQKGEQQGVSTAANGADEKKGL